MFPVTMVLLTTFQMCIRSQTFKMFVNLNHVKMDIISPRKEKKIASVGEDVEKLEPICTVGRLIT